MFSLRTSAITAVATLSVFAASSHAAVIDDFTSTSYPWPLTLASGQTSVSVSEAITDGLGSATRTTKITAAASTAPIRPQAAIYTPDTTPVFEFAETVFQTASVSLTYTGLSADLSTSPTLGVSFAAFDAPSSEPLVIGVSVNGSAYYTADYSTAGAGTFGFLLTSIPGVNLSNVTSLSINFTPPTAGDFAISQVFATTSIVPEPTSAAAMMIPAVGLLARRRR
jgi:hypothetical protein